jgi:hypothetical protein
VNREESTKSQLTEMSRVVVPPVFIQVVDLFHVLICQNKTLTYNINIFLHSFLLDTFWNDGNALLDSPSQNDLVW